MIGPAEQQDASRVGPLGYGRGPVMTAGVLSVVGMMVAGLGVSNLVAHADQAAGESPGKSPSPSAAPTPATLTASAASSASSGADAAVPSSEPAPVEPAKPEYTAYQIKKGDTLAGVSAAAHVPMDTLIIINQVRDPNLIYAGATLLLPTPQA